METIRIAGFSFNSPFIALKAPKLPVLLDWNVHFHHRHMDAEYCPALACIQADKFTVFAECDRISSVHTDASFFIVCRCAD